MDSEHVVDTLTKSLHILISLSRLEVDIIRLGLTPLEALYVAGDSNLDEQPLVSKGSCVLEDVLYQY